MMMEKRNPGTEARAPKINAFGGAKDIGEKYRLSAVPATVTPDWCSIGALSTEIVFNSFCAKYRVNAAIGRTVFDLAGYGRRAA